MVKKNKYGEEYEVEDKYTRGRPDMNELIDEMRLKAEQEKVLGPEAPPMTEEEIKEMKKRYLMKAMGIG